MRGPSVYVRIHRRQILSYKDGPRTVKNNAGHRLRIGTNINLTSLSCFLRVVLGGVSGSAWGGGGVLHEVLGGVSL